MPSKAAYLRYQRQRTPPNSAIKTSAAKQVLAQPKLLENILLHLCKCETVRGIPLKAPVTKLFVLQRVNTLFQATIRGSLALARLMWLYPPEKRTFEQICASLDLQDLYVGPLEWLFNIIGNPIRPPSWDGLERFESRQALDGASEICHRLMFMINAGEGLASCQERSYQHPRASWRDMVAFNAVSEQTTKVRTEVSECIEIKIGSDPAAHSEYHELLFEDEDIQIGADDTLGEIFEKWANKTCESPKRLAKVIRDYVSSEMGMKL